MQENRSTVVCTDEVIYYHSYIALSCKLLFKIQNLCSFIDHLHSSFLIHSSDWCFNLHKDELRVFKLHRCITTTTIFNRTHSPVIISISLVIFSDLTWVLHVHEKVLTKSICPVIGSIPQRLTLNAFESLLSILTKCDICIGHHDAAFIEMAEAKKGQFFSPAKQVSIIGAKLYIHIATFVAYLYKGS